jgi:hypothetical protein
VEALGQKLAQKGRIDVLDHLLQEGLLTSNTWLISSINNSALEGDKVVTVEWLLSYGLLLNGIRQRVMPCHRKLVAYFAQLDAATTAAEAVA